MMYIRVFPTCDSRDHFYQFGEIRNIHVVPKQKCAFVTYETREGAEKAADGSFNKLIVKGTPLPFDTSGLQVQVHYLGHFAYMYTIGDNSVEIQNLLLVVI